MPVSLFVTMSRFEKSTYDTASSGSRASSTISSSKSSGKSSSRSNKSSSGSSSKSSGKSSGGKSSGKSSGTVVRKDINYAAGTETWYMADGRVVTVPVSVPPSYVTSTHHHASMASEPPSSKQRKQEVGLITDVGNTMRDVATDFRDLGRDIARMFF